MTDDVLPLTGTSVPVDGDAALATETCIRHLALLGAGASAGGGGACARISWWPNRGSTCGPAAPPGQAGGELVVQALSGLMAVHGRGRGRPEPAGLEVCSVAAGILAAQGVLAAEIGRSRGLPVRAVETSVLDGALVLLRHHLAIAMADEPLAPRLFEAGCAPPFATADGARVEIEVLRSDAWGRFWGALGADPEAVRRGWLPYLYKHSTAACPLPPGLREAAARHPLGDLLAAAAASGATVRRLRTYSEVLAEPRTDAPWTFAGGPAVGAGSGPAPGDLPLSGLRVIEATTRVQGPLAGLLLQQLGAEVFRVELPGGDPGRGFPPTVGGKGAVFAAYNLGKRPIEVDYHTGPGRRLLADRIAAADVFLHNWRPGRAEELGLGFEELSARSPGLVYCQAAGWGPEDPDGVATDYLVQAHCGLADALTPDGEAPRPTRLTLVDVAGGLVACEGVLAALLHRERTGRGARIDTSLASAAHAFQAHVVEAIGAGREAGRREGRPLPRPFGAPLDTKAGALVVAIEGDADRRRLAEACGVAPTEPDAAIAAALRARPAAEWECLLRDAGVCAAAVRTDLAALPRDPVVGPALQPAEGACRLPAAPWRFAP